MKKVIVIEWVDSVRTFDWTLMEDVDEKSLDCISVGFLLNETEEYVTIAQNYGLKPEQVCNLITIPKCCIKNIREIKDRYTWRPSKEQIDALETATSSLQSTALESLYNELKKLRCD